VGREGKAVPRNSDKFQNFLKSRQINTRSIGFAMGEPGSGSGREMGHLANIARAKTVDSLLQLSRYVYLAWVRFYEPWKSVGRKSKTRLAEAKIAETHWNEFLSELGWSDFPRYQKQIRQLAAIGERYYLLIDYSEKLPGSVSALSVLVQQASDDGALLSAVAQCSPDSTAADVRQMFGQYAAPNGEWHELDGNQVSMISLELMLRPEGRVANAVVLALLFALRINKESLGEDMSLEVIGELDQDLASLTSRLLASTEIQALVRLQNQMAELSGLDKGNDGQRPGPLEGVGDSSKGMGRAALNSAGARSSGRPKL
jgi:hypothetical protein